MIEAAELRPGDRVLEIGAGSGYAAAVIGGDRRRRSMRSSAIARAGASGAQQRLLRAGLRQHRGARRRRQRRLAGSRAVRRDPRRGRRPAMSGRAAPAAGDRRPAGDAGRRQRSSGSSWCELTRTGAGTFEQEDTGDVRFVPLIGEHGWQDEQPADRNRSTHGARRHAESGLRRASRTLIRAMPSRTVARLRRSRLRPHVRPLRRRAGGAAGRSQPRHVGVLSRACRDHAAAGRSARLPHRRGRGRLARRRGDRPLRAPPAGARGRGARRSSASRPGCGATPRSMRSSTGCARTTTRCRRRNAPASTGWICTASTARSAR